ncbi:MULTISPECIES: hypothetical protein [Roseobacteraceae]|uniref:Capsule polysaccharide biosynthesis protein n=1 Tax=Pseudosulfitobacter pseudonitzschiae TaxID=1402135 RepID=A0A221K1F1_9RHOB|nr:MULTISPECIES: hypothetical protein [Roseobacteraceae]ASM72815.1 capsule polysaccharide biosynthesis protein [Pseudosulfitobacter pseudonitzschiae]
MSRIVFHVPRSWLGPLGGGLMPFYTRLTEGLAALDVPFEVVDLDRDSVMAEVEADAAFHIINHGRFTHARILNAGVAYIYPFWNMDSTGIRAFSSIGGQPFKPAQIEAEAARAFFRKLRARLVGARTSRYTQPEEEADVPDGGTAVFFQSEVHRTVDETMWLDRWEMLQGVLDADRGPVMVKPHPRDNDPKTRARLKKMAGVTVTEGNIHDIIAASDRVVTINSAVGIEAYLHRKPVILCGQADFAHIADEARDRATLVDLLRVEPSRRAYDKYIWWYFAHQCLSTTEPDLATRFLDRVRATGFAI